MATITLRSSTVTFTPIANTIAYTGASSGRGVASLQGGRYFAYANEHGELKRDDDFGTNSRAAALKSATNTFTPIANTIVYTGGSSGRGIASLQGSRFVLDGFKILNPSAVGAGGPLVVTPSSVNYAFVINPLVATTAPSIGAGRLTQAAIELAFADAGTSPMRITQAALEIAVAPISDMRISQAALENAHEGLPGDMRATQVAIEMAVVDDREELFNSVPSLAPLDGAKGVPLVPILEIFLDGTEVKRMSSVALVAGVPGAEQWYEPGVLSFGSLSREVDPRGIDFRISELQLEVDNSTGVWSTLKATKGLTGRVARMLLGDPRGSLDDFSVIYTGIIQPNWTLTRTNFLFTIADPFSSVLGIPLFVPITSQQFPFLPEDEPEGGAIPIVYGDHSEAPGRRVGQMPAYLIDPAFTNLPLGGVFRYVACQGDIESVDQVFVKGVEITEGVDYVVLREIGEVSNSTFSTTIDTVVYIDIVADPRLAAGNSNETPGFPVTWSGKGLKGASGLNFTNPAEQLESFMLKYTADLRGRNPFGLGIPRDELALDEADFDAASISAAKLVYEQLGIEASLAMTDAETPLSQVITNFAQSAGLMVTSSVDGKIRFNVLSDRALQPGLVPHLVEGAHIIRDSIEFTANEDVLGVLTFDYDRDYVLNDKFYQRGGKQSDHGTSQDFGGSEEVQMPYIRAAAAASVVADAILYFTEEARSQLHCSIDPHLHNDIELNDVIAVTISSGPSSDGEGWKGQFMRVVGIGFDFSNPSAAVMTLRAVDIRQFATVGEGNTFLTLADTFVTVADPVGIEQEPLFSTLGI